MLEIYLKRGIFMENKKDGMSDMSHIDFKNLSPEQHKRFGEIADKISKEFMTKLYTGEGHRFDDMDFPEDAKLRWKICDLEREADALEKKLENLKDEEYRRVLRSENRGYRKQFYKRLPIGWLDSVYCTRLHALLPYISSTLSTYDLKRDLDTMKNAYYPGEEYKEHQVYVVLCESVVPTKEGVILFMADPYRKIHSQPLEIDITYAEKLIGKMLMIQVWLSEDQLTNPEFDIEKFRELKYTRNGIIDDDGKEKIYKSAISDVMSAYRGVFGHDKCVIAMNKMKGEMIYNGWEVLTNPVDEVESVYFLKDNVWLQVICSSDIIEVLWENNFNFTEKDICLAKENPALSKAFGRREYTSLVYMEDCMCDDPSVDDI